MYYLLAILALSFLVFIHELGHYIMARRVGMRVEVFSVGFGKPIKSWKRNGVVWQIGILPFGGFVKIAGMETEKGIPPEKIRDGFFGKRPIDRIKVALAGPIVNIAFAFLVFTAIYFLGGTTKPFQEKTRVIGWVDPKSELAELGVKMGDTISTYNHRPFTGFRDILYQGLIQDQTVQIAGDRVDMVTHERTPYEYELTPYALQHPMLKGFRTIGVLQTARFCLFEGFQSPSDKECAPLSKSGIQKGDRILWANGEYIASYEQLHDIVNRPSVLVTVERAGHTRLESIPQMAIEELQLNTEQKEEILDWKRDLGFTYSLTHHHFIPYFFDDEGIVVSPIAYAESEEEPAMIPQLVPGDRIIAVNGVATHKASDVLQQVKTPSIHLLVHRGAKYNVKNQQEADALFYDAVDWQAVQEAIGQFSEANPPKGEEGYVFLEPVTPMTIVNYRKEVDALFPINHLPKQVKNTPEAAQDSNEQYLMLGTLTKDLAVPYNPTPMATTKAVLQEMWMTMGSLIKGKLNPKWMSGPVGIVHVMQDSWNSGITEGLFWIGFISLNLGIMNLLPIPVLDGGHICFSLGEIITRRRLSPRTMEKMVLPFLIALVLFFVYVTYHDLLRLFIRLTGS